MTDLKWYFQSEGNSSKDKLECFYNTLDDDKDKYHYVGDREYFKWSDRLQALMGDYGDAELTAQQSMEDQGYTSDSGNNSFEIALDKKLLSTPDLSYLTVYFHWYYAWNTGGGTADVNTTDYWGFW